MWSRGPVCGPQFPPPLISPCPISFYLVSSLNSHKSSLLSSKPSFKFCFLLSFIQLFECLCIHSILNSRGEAVINRPGSSHGSTNSRKDEPHTHVIAAWANSWDRVAPLRQYSRATWPKAEIFFSNVSIVEWMLFTLYKHMNSKYMQTQPQNTKGHVFRVLLNQTLDKLNNLSNTWNSCHPKQLSLKGKTKLQ